MGGSQVGHASITRGDHSSVVGGGDGSPATRAALNYTRLLRESEVATSDLRSDLGWDAFRDGALLYGSPDELGGVRKISNRLDVVGVHQAAHHCPEQRQERKLVLGDASQF
jgi:hypothetical protein